MILATKKIVLCLAANFLTAAVLADGTFVPAEQRADHIFDPSTRVLYVTNGAQLVRYDVAHHKALPPLKLGHRLTGIDLSPDGSTLAVGDYGSNEGPRVFLVNLKNLSVKKKRFVPYPGEDGIWSVAFVNDQSILTTSTYAGSGWVPMHRFDIATGATTVLGTISQDTMLSASADRSVVGFAEANISDGRFGIYRTLDGFTIHHEGYDEGTAWFNYEIGASRDGSQFALPTYFGTFITDAMGIKTGLVIGEYASGQPICAAFHPLEDKVYFPWADSSQIYVYDTKTWTRIGSYDFETNFEHPGNGAYVNGRTKVSRDGTLLVSSVLGGVRFVRIAESHLVALTQQLSLDEDGSLPLQLQANGAVGATTFEVVGRPKHGKLLGKAPNLTYVPAPDFHGKDSLTFRVQDADLAEATGTVEFDVASINDAPVAVADNLRLLRGNSIEIDVLANDLDVDGDPITVKSVTSPKFGVAVLLESGKVRYTPKAGFVGVDTFYYTITDPSGATSTARVAVAVARR